MTKWDYMRHGVSAVTQAWYQVSHCLPRSAHRQINEVNNALDQVLNAIFEAEIKEAQLKIKEAQLERES